MDAISSSSTFGLTAQERRELERILDFAEDALSLRRVYLFGSRARGDERSGSDIDLAFEHSSSDASWADFVNRMRDEAAILLDLDLVDFSHASPDLRNRILREGMVLRG